MDADVGFLNLFLLYCFVCFVLVLFGYCVSCSGGCVVFLFVLVAPWAPMDHCSLPFHHLLYLYFCQIWSLFILMVFLCCLLSCAACPLPGHHGRVEDPHFFTYVFYMIFSYQTFCFILCCFVLSCSVHATSVACLFCLSSGKDPSSVALSGIARLRTEDIAHCTDCKARWGNVTVILGNMNKTDLIHPLEWWCLVCSDVLWH